MFRIFKAQRYCSIVSYFKHYNVVFRGLLLSALVEFEVVLIALFSGVHKLFRDNFKMNYTGLFKKKCTLSKINFSKTADAKSMSSVRMERKYLKVLISMIWSGASLRLWRGCCYLWHAATSVGRAGLSIWHLPRHTWGSHRVLVRCENNFLRSLFSLI
jgi:hypothetical protein